MATRECPLRMDGKAGSVEEFGICPGERIFVMPRVDSKKLERANGILRTLYQIAVATKVAVGL